MFMGDFAKKQTAFHLWTIKINANNGFLNYLYLTSLIVDTFALFLIPFSWTCTLMHMLHIPTMCYVFKTSIDSEQHFSITIFHKIPLFV